MDSTAIFCHVFNIINKTPKIVLATRITHCHDVKLRSTHCKCTEMSDDHMYVCLCSIHTQRDDGVFITKLVQSFFNEML